jgi:hypothetical protein
MRGRAEGARCMWFVDVGEGHLTDGTALHGVSMDAKLSMYVVSSEWTARRSVCSHARRLDNARPSR